MDAAIKETVSIAAIKDIVDPIHNRACVLCLFAAN